MKEVIKIIVNAIGGLLSSYFSSDTDFVMSKEARKIFAHKGDRKKYIEAIEELNKNPDMEEKSIILHTGEKITLINH